MPSSARERRAVIVCNGGSVATGSEVRFHCQFFTVIDQIAEQVGQCLFYWQCSGLCAG
jgi:hypothetical protein